MQNPFESLIAHLLRIEKKIDILEEKTNLIPEPVYTVKEVAKILRVSEQTVRKKIDQGIIEADVNTKPFLIHHSALYDKENRLKKFKYKRV